MKLAPGQGNPVPSFAPYRVRTKDHEFGNLKIIQKLEMKVIERTETVRSTPTVLALNKMAH